MKVIDPGHEYELTMLDLPEGFVETLMFVKREGPGYPGNVGHHPGTNIQEVLRALIDRVKYLNNQITDARNGRVISHLRNAMWLLEDRAAERHGRTLDVHMREIEKLPTCTKCGHVSCEGKCDSHTK